MDIVSRSDNRIQLESQTALPINPVGKMNKFLSSLEKKHDYTVKFVLAVDNNGNRYYDHKLTEIEKNKLLNELDRITSPSSQEENVLSDVKDKRLLSIFFYLQQKMNYVLFMFVVSAA